MPRKINIEAGESSKQMRELGMGNYINYASLEWTEGCNCVVSRATGFE